MKKAIFTLITTIIIFTGIFLISTGFQKRSDVSLFNYSVSEDGRELTFTAYPMSSMGYIRGYKNSGGGVKDHYLTFYSTFGGLNSTLGAKNEFTLSLDLDDSEIYFYKGNGGYELVLTKEEATGQWKRPKDTNEAASQEIIVIEGTMSDYLKYEIPDGYGETEFQPMIQDTFSGILFTGYEEPHHAEFTEKAWYCAGGLLISTDKDRFVFKDGKLIDVLWSGNHMGRTQEVEVIDGCNMQAIITEYTFDLFTAAEWVKYEEEHQITLSEEDAASKYWYIFFGEEGNDVCYAAFLNGKLFSKEEAIKYAKTLSFK